MKEREVTWGLSDAEVEKEIEKLSASDEVKLARKELRLKYKKRQKLYSLIALYKQGKALLEAGITSEILDSIYANLGEDDD